MPGAVLQNAIINALARAGDGTAVEPLERIRRIATPEFRELIDEALPILRQRRQQERDASRLLRPSDGAGSAVLLRPMAGVESQSSETLLRPAVDM